MFIDWGKLRFGEGIRKKSQGCIFLKSERGEYVKKTLGKRKVTKGMKRGRVFISKDNNDSSTCNISKEHYGAYEVVVLYN